MSIISVTSYTFAQARPLGKLPALINVLIKSCFHVSKSLSLNSTFEAFLMPLNTPSFSTFGGLAGSGVSGNFRNNL